MRPWRIAYEVEASAPQKLFNAISLRRLDVYAIQQSGETLHLEIPVWYKRRFERLLAELGCGYNVTALGLLPRTAAAFKRRCGLVIGAAICAAAIFAAQYYVISIRVLTDDEEVRQNVMNVLSDCGVGSGSYIPDIECAKVERSLKQRVDGISWAGITLTDSTLTIDVIENIPKAAQRRERVPSDLVAAHSGVVEHIELYNGVAVKPIGSGVLKGEVLVSGVVPTKRKSVDDEGRVMTEETTKYVRSVGTVYGTYTDIKTFSQPLREVTMVQTPSKLTRRYLKIFGSELALFHRSPEGLYSVSSEYQPLEIFGTELPVGLRTDELCGYRFSTVLYTEEQAEEHVRLQSERYEKNFLSDCEILSRSEQLSADGDTVTLTVTYEVRGVLSEERPALID